MLTHRMRERRKTFVYSNTRSILPVYYNYYCISLTHTLAHDQSNVTNFEYSHVHTYIYIYTRALLTYIQSQPSTRIWNKYNENNRSDMHIYCLLSSRAFIIIVIIIISYRSLWCRFYYFTYICIYILYVFPSFFSFFFLAKFAHSVHQQQSLHE